MSETTDNVSPENGGIINKKTKKPKQVQSITPTNLPPLSDKDREQMELITKELNDKIATMLKTEIENKLKKNPDLDHLNAILKEYMNTFLLLGYTLEGEPFILSFSKTPQDYNALVEHLRLTFMNTFKSPMF